MRKSILIGVIVAVLALGAMGAAFATDLDFTEGVGALSESNSQVPQANVDEIYWGLETNDGEAASDVYYVRLSFDRDLNQGTLIGVAVYDSGSNLLAEAHPEIDAALLASDNYKVQFATPVLASDIYHIRVTVGEAVPFK